MGRTVLAALGWKPGHRIAVAVRHGAIVTTRSDHGHGAISADGCLVLPVAARRMCGTAERSAVLLAALPDAGLLVVHPIATLAKLLARRHAKIIGGSHGRST